MQTGANDRQRSADQAAQHAARTERRRRRLVLLPGLPDARAQPDAETDQRERQQRRAEQSERPDDDVRVEHHVGERGQDQENARRQVREHHGVEQAKARREAIPKDAIICDWHYDALKPENYPSLKVFRDAGIGPIEDWKPLEAPARRRRWYDDANGTMAVLLASASDLDDLIPTLVAYQVEWNKLHATIRASEAPGA